MTPTPKKWNETETVVIDGGTPTSGVLGGDVPKPGVKGSSKA